MTRKSLTLLLFTGSVLIAMFAVAIWQPYTSQQAQRISYKAADIARSTFYRLRSDIFLPFVSDKRNTTDLIPFDQVIIDAQVAGDVKLVGDIDGDTFPDLVIGGMPDEKLNWYRYPDWEKTVIATPNTEFTTDGALGDVDGDGDLDIVVPDGGGGDNLVWFENPRPQGDVADGDQWLRHIIGSVGSWGKDVELADFDQDGNLDVATRHNNAATIFFQTNPDTWTRMELSGMALGSEGMASGDIDGDGAVDLVLQGVWVKNPAGEAAHVADNWQSYDIGWAGENFKALVADINQDDVMDVLFSSSEDTASVDWWTPVDGNPTGAWRQNNILEELDRAHTLQAADMDNDGDMDVVVGQMHTSSDKKLMILLNTDGKGTLWQQQIVDTEGLHNGVVADIGNDGDYDIYGANWTGNPPVRLWINRLDPPDSAPLPLNRWTYKQVTDQGAQTFGLAFGDVDRDGNTDILAGPYWYRNPGGDMLEAWLQHGLPDEMHAVVVVDIDNDNNIDIIAQRDEGEIGVYWLESTDNGTTWEPVRIGTLPRASHGLGAQGYRIANLESSTRPEILFSSGQGIYYFRVPDKPALGEWPRIQVNANPSDEGLATGDIDRDGHIDVVATTGESKRVEWYRNPGTGAAQWEAIRIDTIPNSVFPDRTEVADLNGDGRLDVIVTEENGQTSEAETYWWSQPEDPIAGKWIRQLVTSQGTTNSMDVADMDLDGEPDVILAEHRGDKKLAVWNNVGGGFIEQVISTDRESHLGARTVDLDGDSDLDIVSIAWDEYPLIHLWRNDALKATDVPKSGQIYLPCTLVNN